MNFATSVRARVALTTMTVLSAGVAHAQYRGGPGAGVQFATAGDPVAVWIGHTESSNVLRTDSGDRGSYDSLGALFNISRERERSRAGVVGNVEYRKYADIPSADESVGSLGAFFTPTLIEDRLIWVFDDRYLQGRTNPFGPETPGNREHINIATSGPELDLPLGGRTSLSSSATYTERRYSDTEALDSDAVTYALGLHRRFRRTTDLSIVAQTTETQYDDENVADYEVDSLRVGYERELAKGRAIATYGTNRLTSGGVESERPLVQVSWGRTLTARSSLIVVATRQYTDAGQLLYESLEDLAATDEPEDVSLTSTANDRREVSTSWNLTLNQTQISVRAVVFDDNFDGDDSFDSRGGRFGVDMQHQLGPVSTLGAGMHVERRTFEQDDTENTDTVLRVRYSRQLRRVLDLEVDGQLTQRDGSDSFDERTYRVTLIYIPGR